ncbi:MAG: trehalose-6-phosphate synthase [Patescibacteria group bacterium]
MFETETTLEKIHRPQTNHKMADGRHGAWSEASTMLAELLSKKTRSIEASLTPETPHWKRIIIVHNRLPFNIKHDALGNPSVSPSAGGLVTAMSPLFKAGMRSKWVGWPGTEKDEGLEDAVRAVANGKEIGIVRLTKDEVEGHYEGYSNKVLTPLFESAIDKIDYSDIDTNWIIYQEVQKKFAHKVAEDVRADDVIWIHDWHLTGVGKELREMGVDQPLGFFLHIPFPHKEELALLPQYKILLQNLLAHDIVGFQTDVFKKRFIDAVCTYIPGVVVEKQSDTVTLLHIGERVIRVGNFPISIDPKEFLEQVAEPPTVEYARRLDKELRKDGEVQLIFNAGRLDYIKGFYEELLAFDRLLEKHPELIGKVVLFQLVIPSRESILAYKEYKEKILALAEKINRKHKIAITQKPTSESEQGESFAAYEDMPVRQVHAHMDRSMYLAHLHVADIQSVPTKADGMNLVAKEGAVVGKSTMVQLLGKDAGVAEELADSAVIIDPDNTESFADALYEAYAMKDAEKTTRKSKMLSVIQSNDVFSWWSKEQGPLFQEVWTEKTKNNPSLH